jgi:uncharacterized protein (TIGR03000 family)
MYSIVLMAALSTGGTAPDFHCFRHCGCGGYGGWGGYGCYGCYGGYGCYGCYGCYGGWGCYGCNGCWGGGGYGPMQFVPSRTDPKSEEAPLPRKEKGKDTSMSNRARLIVQIPTGAKLFIDDNPMRVTSSSRSFVTPPLQRGRTYYYEVRAEVVREGRTVSETQRVILRPGEIVQAAFPGLDRPATSTAQNSEE